MNRNEQRRPRATWKVFVARDGRGIESLLRCGHVPCCPLCGDCLEARPASRLAPQLPLGASAYDLDCRECRRFWCVVRHTERSLRLVRMRRLAAAVRAVEPRPGRDRNAADPRLPTAL